MWPSPRAVSPRKYDDRSGDSVALVLADVWLPRLRGLFPVRGRPSRLFTDPSHYSLAPHAGAEDGVALFSPSSSTSMEMAISISPRRPAVKNSLHIWLGT